MTHSGNYSLWNLKLYVFSTEILTTEEIWIGVNVPYVPKGRKLADAIVDEYAMKKRNTKIEKSQNSKRRKLKLFFKDYIERASILFWNKLFWILWYSKSRLMLAGHIDHLLDS